MIDAQHLHREMMVMCGFIDVTICPLQSAVHTNIMSSVASETMPQLISMEDPLSPVPPHQHAHTLGGRNVKSPLPSWRMEGELPPLLGGGWQLLPPLQLPLHCLASNPYASSPALLESKYQRDKADSRNCSKRKSRSIFVSMTVL